MQIQWKAQLVALFVACALAACGESTEVAGNGGGGGGPQPTPPPVDPGKACSVAADEATERHILGLADGAVDQYIISFEGSAPLNESQRDLLVQLGVRGIYLNRLPIAGVLATRQQALRLSELPGVRSVRLNSQLVYEDEQASLLTSATQAAKAPELVNAAGEPITGKGLTILVNDSGIDATHQDLMYGSKVLANALGHTNLRGIVSGEDPTVGAMLPATPSQDVPNSDVFGSHGTHVAGIAAGDGSASGGLFIGSAPGATLAGYGSGAVIFVLDALAGFDYALHLLDERPELNLRIVTNSFGQTNDLGTCFDPDNPTNIATKALVDRNVIVIFSAGNSGSGPDTITGNFKKAPWVLTAANAEKTGLLNPGSSRGSLSRGSYEVVVDGETMIVEDRPTVAAPGTDIVSARAIAADPFTPLDAQADFDKGDIPPEMLPFYTQKTGTSMAAPHLAGLVALLLEANPALTWREVRPLLKHTATNMPGYAPWEVGSGLTNIEAAIAEAQQLRTDYGLTNNTVRGFNAAIDLGAAEISQHQIDFAPVGEADSVSFEVDANKSLVIAQWNQPLGDPCTCAIVLTDPAGTHYGSSIALPVLGAAVSASAPASPGTWTLTVSGVGGLNVGPGITLDPLGVSNGVAGPSTLDITLQLFNAGVPRGLGDIVGHPAQALIELAVAKRLVDGLPGGFSPDQPLTRAQMAEYLMAWGVKQTREHDGSKTYADTDGLQAAAAEAVTRVGALTLDLREAAAPLMSAAGAAFNPGGAVVREQMAYALVQAMGREAGVAQYEGLTMFAVDSDGMAVPVVDADAVTPALRNHVQDALVLNLLPVEFFEEDGTRKARIQPQAGVSRADYATSVGRAYLAVPFPT